MSKRETLAGHLLLAMDGDFLPGAGMSGSYAGKDVPLDEARPKEVMHWAAGESLSWLAGVLADDATVEVCMSALGPHQWPTRRGLGTAADPVLLTRKECTVAILAALSAHLATGPVRAGDTSGEDGQ